MSDPIYFWGGIVPMIDHMAFVHPEAVETGDVIIGPACHIGPGAGLRSESAGRVGT